MVTLFMRASDSRILRLPLTLPGRHFGVCARIARRGNELIMRQKIDASPGWPDAPRARLASCSRGSCPRRTPPSPGRSTRLSSAGPRAGRPSTQALPIAVRDARIHADARPAGADVRPVTDRDDGGPPPMGEPAPTGAISERGHRLACILARPVPLSSVCIIRRRRGRRARSAPHPHCRRPVPVASMRPRACRTKGAHREQRQEAQRRRFRTAPGNPADGGWCVFPCASSAEPRRASTPPSSRSSTTRRLPSSVSATPSWTSWRACS